MKSVSTIIRCSIVLFHSKEEMDFSLEQVAHRARLRYRKYGAIEGSREKTRSKSVFEAELGRMGKGRESVRRRQERRNVSFSGAEERVAPFESSFFPSST